MPTSSTAGSLVPVTAITVGVASYALWRYFTRHEARTRKRWFRVVVLGDSLTGKSTLIRQFDRGEFMTQYNATVEHSFVLRELQVANKLPALVQVWDTPGRSLQCGNRECWSSAEACVLLFDVTSSTSFENLANWYDVFLKNSQKLEPVNVPVFVLGNKVDLNFQRIINRERVQLWCRERSMTYYEISTKDRSCLETVFQSICRTLMRHRSGNDQKLTDVEIEEMLKFETQRLQLVEEDVPKTPRTKGEIFTDDEEETIPVHLRPHIPEVPPNQLYPLTTALEVCQSADGVGAGRPLNIIFLGDKAVGKTEFINVVTCGRRAFGNEYKPTFGMDFTMKWITLDGVEATLQLWDTSGHSDLAMIGKGVLKSADVVVLMFDVTSQDSFDYLTVCRSQFLSAACPSNPGQFPFVVLGNKCDLMKERAVLHDHCERWAREIGQAVYFDLSAKNVINLEVAMRAVIHHAMTRAASMGTSGDSAEGNAALNSSAIGPDPGPRYGPDPRPTNA
eukprot:GFYU01008550.1.p1 GENE.GFYU01008550.1~~GFYU01008550.1.p1  ORF type:complete len:506 (+),score=78.45 GFYU01008550.1:270-1787(+)